MNIKYGKAEYKENIIIWKTLLIYHTADKLNLTGINEILRKIDSLCLLGEMKLTGNLAEIIVNLSKNYILSRNLRMTG